MSTTTSPSSLLARIDLVLSTTYRITGRHIDWRSAVRLVEQIIPILGNDLPVKAWEVALGSWLIGESYTPESIKKIICHAKIFNTVIGSPDLDKSDEEAAEEIAMHAAHWALSL
jgi:hypothetical protein